MTDKSLSVIGITEGPLINHGAQSAAGREPEWSVMQEPRGDICQKVHREFTLGGVKLCAEQDQDKAGGM